MPKINDILSNIFSRSKQHLETDAVPAPDSENDESPPPQQISEEITTSQLLEHESAMAGTASQQLVPSPGYRADLIASNGFPPGSIASNNMLAINNTHAQNVYQFSNITGLHIGQVYQFGSTEDPHRKSSGEQKDVPRTNSRTRTIHTMLQSDEPLNTRYLSVISKHLGQGWQDIMRQLRFSEGQIHQAVVDYQIDGGIQEVIYQLILDWSRNADNATLGEITSILWNSGHKETVYYLKLCYKAEKMSQKQSEKSQKDVM